jgi:isopenicillin N synthase-like dioxygenase
MRSVTAGIETIDLSDYTSCDTSLRSRFVKHLGVGLVERGCVVVEGHAVEARLVGEVYAAWRRFFGLAEGDKRRYAGIEGGARGFTPFGVEHAKDHPTPDLKEFWHVGQEAAAGAEAGPENVWPAEVPEARGVTVQLYRELERVAQLLLMALAEHLGLPEDELAEMARGGSSVLRILHYPAIEGAVAAGAERAAPHEDINFITLLCEATDAGLAVRGRDGQWVPVAVRPGQIVVNAGEMLSRVTNEVVLAATHRVVNPAGPAGERFSMPFFVHPRAECDLSALDRFVSAERPGRFPAMTAGQLLEERLHAIGLKG